MFKEKIISKWNNFQSYISVLQNSEVDIWFILGKRISNGTASVSNLLFQNKKAKNIVFIISILMFIGALLRSFYESPIFTFYFLGIVVIIKAIKPFRAIVKFLKFLQYISWGFIKVYAVIAITVAVLYGIILGLNIIKFPPALENIVNISIIAVLLLSVFNYYNILPDTIRSHMKPYDLRWESYKPSGYYIFCLLIMSFNLIYITTVIKNLDISQLSLTEAEKPYENLIKDMLSCRFQLIILSFAFIIHLFEMVISKYKIESGHNSIALAQGLADLSKK